LNAVTPDVHRRHHDYDLRMPYQRRVSHNLEILAELRVQRRSRTLLGVSVVVDRNNVDDIEAVAEFVSGLCKRHGAGAVDYLILRPAFPLNGAQIDTDDDVRAAFLAHTCPTSQARRLLAEAGVDVVAPDASLAEVEPLPPDDRGCLAAGWFGEVTPSGDLLPCSDLYGDPPGNGRGHHLNRVFREVERLREAGRLADVERWADDLRAVLPQPEHSFFL
ncbi:MAG: hypothetical protein ACRDQZ_05305, partial [Mycobacteriales bacterium]